MVGGRQGRSGSGYLGGEGVGGQQSQERTGDDVIYTLPQCRRPWLNPWVGKIPWRREQLPTPVFWPGEFHGLYRPWGLKESDTTERLALSLSHGQVGGGATFREAPSSSVGGRSGADRRQDRREDAVPAGIGAPRQWTW